MKKVYFDDLFLIIHNDGYTLCEYIPYEQHKELITVVLDQDYITPEQLIYSIIQSEEFKKLNLKVEGIHHRLIKNKDIKQQVM